MTFLRQVRMQLPEGGLAATASGKDGLHFHIRRKK